MEHITQIKNFNIDLTRLQNETSSLLSSVDWNKHNQLCFLNTEDHLPDLHQGVGNTHAVGYPASGLLESDFTKFNLNYLDSIFYEIWKTFPYSITRMRLMRLPPKRCYSLHTDGSNEIRYHTAVFTNPDAYFVYKNPVTMFHIPGDGTFYKVSVEPVHSAINFSPIEDRIHLVLNARL
jgi:hypothetical protein